MLIDRLRTMLALALVLLAFGARAEPVTLTDLTGRKVTLPAPARRIVLAQGRHLNALALLHPDPVSLVAGWGDDLKRDRATYDLYRRRFPAIERVPDLGSGAARTFSLEKAISLEPDLVVLSRFADGGGGAAQAGEVARRFEAIGVPVIVIDFFQAPLEETEASLRILGEAIGRPEAALAYNRFYREHLDRIAARLKAPGLARPRVFMHAHAGGPTCCYSPGRGVFDQFIRAAGGHNIGADILPGATGELSPEYVASAKPDIYVGTGGTYQIRSGGLVLGSGVSAEEARRSLAATLARLNLLAISSLPPERIHGMWQLFNDTPVHVVAVELLAKWLHPELFGDLDPAATLREINERFLSVPLEGTYWTSLGGTE
ncbi:ABC transporter substrate-binding protein [Enterovirga sp.]|uniref:ABC transporter substrate-binding protein n=1 Tax=Enterovirga sp. TaxID=2026350 RepID=UPI002BD5060D|nr:ABC transporter substrate-binding protein [Enterovirga sp.]HMO27932.1 ABC transporter substrate-binding protein [Enterovirga sp.]